MQNKLLSLVVLVLLLASTGTAVAYNYAEAEDPMAIIFKTAIAAATKSNWKEVSSQAKKGISLQKGHHFEAGHLSSRLEETIKKKNISETAELFAQLVYLSLSEKLHTNKKEQLKNYKDGRARIQLAYKSYKDTLDGNVKKQDTGRSRTIHEQFQIALSSIGNPGLFGIGKKVPDPQKYNESIKTIDDLILKTFPSFKQ